MVTRPITYRAEIIAPLLTSLAAGECCSVVGINGVGKSNLVQHMQQAEVLRHYLEEQAQALHFVTLDANLLAIWDEWGFFEGLAEALLTGVAACLPAQDIASLRDMHAQVIATPGNYALALRHCSTVLQLILHQTRLVIVCDEFDPLFTSLSGIVLRNLRGLRDRHKYRLMYLTFSRERLTDLRGDAEWEAIEPFVELLTLRELGLHPLQPDDATAEALRFAARHERSLAADISQQIVSLSGGHPALVRALTQLALDGQDVISVPAELLRRTPALRLECRKIWDQCTSEEQDNLWRIAGGMAVNPWQGSALHLKGLVRTTPEGVQVVFSPLLHAYLLQIYAPPTASTGRPLQSDAAAAADPPALIIDLDQQQVCYYGQEIGTLLTPLQYRLLAYLYQRFGQVCAFDEVAQAVYALDKVADHREPLATLTRRLRQRLAELVPEQPVLLRVYKGRGYRLGFPAE